MTDTGVAQSIRSMLDSITAHDDLKTVARDVQRRGKKLDASNAAIFKKGDLVSWARRGRLTNGTVQGVEGARVLVRLEHGFVARIPPDELRASTPARGRRVT
jgi:hypothetical protein